MKGEEKRSSMCIGQSPSSGGDSAPKLKSGGGGGGGLPCRSSSTDIQKGTGVHLAAEGIRGPLGPGAGKGRPTNKPAYALKYFLGQRES